MAKVKALKSFSGVVNMAIDQVSDIQDEYILNDLVNAGYVEVLEKEEQTVEDEQISEEQQTNEEEQIVEKDEKKAKSSKKKGDA